MLCLVVNQGKSAIKEARKTANFTVHTHKKKDATEKNLATPIERERERERSFN